MTLEQIEASKSDVLTTADVAEVLGCTPYSINLQAQRAPDSLGFPVIVSGTRVRIPREGFLFFMRYGRPVIPGEPNFKEVEQVG